LIPNLSEKSGIFKNIARSGWSAALGARRALIYAPQGLLAAPLTAASHTRQCT
jgi:hypothetical protein